MKLQIVAGLATLALANAALADGDAAKGARDFRKCKACHSIIAPDGTKIQPGGRVGPNLYGVVGRKAASGTFPDGKPFPYERALEELADKGLVWDEELIAHYVVNPTEFVREETGDKTARVVKMPPQRVDGEDVAAYLASVAPASN